MLVIYIRQRGSLGRPRIEESARSDRCPIWYATPGRVPKIGPRHACKAVWVTSSGEQTFVQVSQALIKTDTLFSSTITANNNSIGNMFAMGSTGVTIITLTEVYRKIKVKCFF